MIQRRVQYSFSFRQKKVTSVGAIYSKVYAFFVYPKR